MNSTPAKVPTDAELESLARRLGEALAARGWTAATAESCTGGWISKAITDIAGSSRWFGAGYVVYSNDAKTKTLGVPAELIAEAGAVSEPVVTALAEAARERAGADIAVAVSGIAGPGGGTPEKPVGTVWFAWAGPHGTVTERQQFDGDREAVRRQTVALALEGLIDAAEWRTPRGRGAAGLRSNPGDRMNEIESVQIGPEEPEREAGLRRIFFALWPDDATRGAIERACRQAVRRSGGRPTAKRNLHLTVAFLGMLEPDALEIAAAVPPIGVGPFEIVLDRIGYFEGSRVLWLGPRNVPPSLTALEQQLWEELERVGFEREPRVYLPHVTLARRARAVDATIEPIRWVVERLTLVESLPLQRGVHYEPLRDWPL
ncbi:MAG: RNA 2',3'-cyclic phosphodiesterase [Gammaproteobacteria bacterium]|nr:RNA 2',3'-cyclic phosphodiesterase [Gammaproteobacteria bacterium]